MGAFSTISATGITGVEIGVSIHLSLLSGQFLDIRKLQQGEVAGNFSLEMLQSCILSRIISAFPSVRTISLLSMMSSLCDDIRLNMPVRLAQ